jgi:ribonuclease Z
LSSANAFQVDHTKWACGYSFTTLKEKRKIVFSGDTKACDNIIRNGKNADLLIHECTFEDDMEVFFC